MKRVYKSLTSRQGMTLVEAIVATAIVAVAALLLFTGFSAMARLLGESAERKNAQSALSENIATSSGEKSAKRYTLDLNGLEVAGNIVTYTDESGARFSVFEEN